MSPSQMPATGTCVLRTLGRRTGRWRSVELWYVVTDAALVLTGTPGPRAWVANLRVNPAAVVRLRDPQRERAVVAREVTDPDRRRRIIAEAWRLQPWYAEQPYSVEEWVASSPVVVLDPRGPSSGTSEAVVRHGL
ncbi:nitroreductase/quinone reductase family protein [Cellulomonas sp. T2.31MG-18]|uniref:nitroreductase/quinone reductase family protein n=1 Tax=Cellulomonas sp. T2.31MG-18 TaxID=3157619 RepID=UPI00367028E8